MRRLTLLLSMILAVSAVFSNAYADALEEAKCSIPRAMSFVIEIMRENDTELARVERKLEKIAKKSMLSKADETKKSNLTMIQKQIQSENDPLNSLHKLCKKENKQLVDGTFKATGNDKYGSACLVEFDRLISKIDNEWQRIHGVVNAEPEDDTPPGGSWLNLAANLLKSAAKVAVVCLFVQASAGMVPSAAAPINNPLLGSGQSGLQPGANTTSPQATNPVVPLPVPAPGKTGKNKPLNPLWTPSLHNLAFDELTPFSDKPTGINTGGVYVLKNNPNQKVFLKGLVREDPTDNSLVLSYLTSRVLELIVPGQGPLIVPVVGTPEPMIASFALEDFASSRYGRDGEDSVKLNLALDLMDIDDRHMFNLGTAMSNGRRVAAVVDIDMFGGFQSSWLESLDAYFNTPKAELESALKAMASVSDESLRSAYYAGVHELEEVLKIPSLGNHFDTDYMFDMLLQRKHQMKWALAEVDTFYETFHGDLSIETARKVKEDKYGFFLINAIRNYKTDVVKLLLEGGAKDPDGNALKAAARIDNLPIVNLLLKHGAKDLNGYALVWAIENRNAEMTQILFENGARDPKGLALETAVRNNDLVLINALLARGSPDPRGAALKWALENGNLEMFDQLIIKGARDPDGSVISLLIQKGLFEALDKLLARGAKDPFGYALSVAVDANNTELVKRLIEIGAKDPWGIASNAAQRLGNLEIIQLIQKIR